MFRFSRLLALILTLCFSFHVSAAWQEVKHEDLSYWRYTPNKTKNNSKRALLVVLHGCAQKNTHLKEAGNLVASADKTGTILMLPQVPKGGVIAGCWDFYGADHTRENRYHGALIGAIKSEVENKELGINPERVFVAGISSGAGEALVLACLVPDLVRGVGLVAGVAVGHQARDISKPKLSALESKEICQKLAPGHQEELLRLKVSIIYGSEDRLVDQEHSKLIAQMFTLMRTSTSSEDFSLASLAGTHTKGVGTRYMDQQGVFMTLIENEGLGHAWPSGVSGARAPFVSDQSIDYPAYLLNFLLKN